MKLYDEKKSNEVITLKPSIVKEELDINIDSDVSLLDETVMAYSSVSTVYSAVANEEFSFIEKKNYVLFNEYITSITRNLGLKTVPTVATEDIDTLPGLVVNHQLSLEGFLGTLWDKIRSMFRKIYDAMVEFGKRHFTRLGRLKKKLENLESVLSETDKDLKQVNLDKVPSGVSKSFPISGAVSESTIDSAIQVADNIIKILEVTNKDAIGLAEKDIISKELVANIKSLKDQTASNNNRISENEANKVTGFGKFYGKGKDKNSKLNAENKGLKAENKANQSEINQGEDQIKGLGAGGDTLGDDQAFEAAKRDMAAYHKKVADAYKPIIGKPIPGGKVITEVKIDEEGIELVSEDNKDTPDSLSLGSRNTLLNMVKEGIATMKIMDKATDNYAKVNDAIMKNLDNLDKIIKDLDKIGENPDYKAYRNVLDKKVKERLKMMQKFFGGYNKTNKNMIDSVTSVYEGVVVYAVASLKHFG